MPVCAWLWKRRKIDAQTVQEPCAMDTSAHPAIEARISTEFEQRMIRIEMLWLTGLVCLAILAIVVNYVTHFRSPVASAAFITLTASYAFFSLRKRFAKSREDARKVSLSLCSQWLTYKYPSGENRTKLEAIKQVSFSRSPYSDLSITTDNGRTIRFIGFDKTEEIYSIIQAAAKYREA